MMDDQSVWLIVVGGVSSTTLLSVILLINCYLINHYKLPSPSRPATPRNKVTPSPSLSSTQMSHWVSNMNQNKALHREDSF